MMLDLTQFSVPKMYTTQKDAIKALVRYIWNESPYKFSVEFRETLGLEFIGDNDRIYEYFDSLEQEMLHIRFLTDPRCIKDG